MRAKSRVSSGREWIALTPGRPGQIMSETFAPRCKIPQVLKMTAPTDPAKQYKCDDAGAWFEEVSETFSTQACSACGCRSGPKGLGIAPHAEQCATGT